MSRDNLFEEKLNRCLSQDRLPFKTTSQDEARKAVMARTVVVYHLKTRIAFLKLAAAALIFVLGSLWVYYLLGATTVQNMHSRTFTHILPDGSSIVLKRGSTVKYNTSSWFLNRKVELVAGRAFFEVEKGKKFVASTALGSVSVLGTSFDINLSDNNFIVACKSGAVQVNVGNYAPVILTSGNELNLNLRKTAIEEIETSEIAAWTDSIIEFNEASLQRVFETLASETDYKFEYPQNLTLRYSGRVNLNLPIAEILEIVCVPHGLFYTIDSGNHKVYINKNKEL